MCFDHICCRRRFSQELLKALVVRHSLFCALSFSMMFLMVAFPLYAQSQPPRPAVRMEAAPQRVYQGESLRLQIQLDHFDSYEAPDISYLQDTFEVEYLGEQNRNSSMIVILNGKQQKTEERGMTYNYRLTPKQTGRIRIEPPEIQRGNAIASTFPVEIEVIAPINQDEVRLELTTSATNIYPLIPFEVILSVYVRELPGRYRDRNPVTAISRQTGPAVLNIPWLTDEKLPRGLLPQENWQDWISAYRNGNGGFVINNIRIDSPFDFGWSLFDNQRSGAKFLPQGTVVELPLPDGQKGQYWKYDFVRSFIGEKPGQYIFDAATIKGVFAKEANNNEMAAVDVYTLSNFVTVNVKDIPIEECPDDYIGAFGEFTWKANLTPEKATLGEAMTLTLTLEGKGALLNVRQIDLTNNAAVTENFKVYPPTEEITKNTARFTYSLRPIRSGKITFPTIPVSYFDVRTEKFVSVHTPLINIDVEQSQSSESVDTFTGLPLRVNHKTSSLKRSSGGIFANIVSPPGAVNQKITLQQWGKELGILTGIGLLSWICFSIFRHDRFLSARHRAKVIAAASDQLSLSLNDLGADDLRESANAASDIRSCFLELIADCFHKPVTTLTEGEIRSILDELASQSPNNLASPEKLGYLQKTGNKIRQQPILISRQALTASNCDLIHEVQNLFVRLEEIQYGFEATTAEKIRKETPQLFEQWSVFTSLRKNRKTIKTIAAHQEQKQQGRSAATQGEVFKGKNLFLFLAITLLMTGCTPPRDTAQQEEFTKAIALFDEADAHESPKLFEKVAAIYQGLIDSGTESGPILYNQGNAWMRAGQEAKALAAWNKAKRYMPNNPYLTANFETFTPQFQGEKGKPLPELIFFWQDWISYPMKFRMTTLLAFHLLFFFIILVLPSTKSDEKKSDPELLLRQKRAMKLIQQATVVIGILFLIMTFSALYDWYRFDRMEHIVVASTDVVARKGNSVKYQSVFAAPLPKLTNGIILEEQNHWLRVRFPDGQDGWIPATDVVRW